MGDRASPDLAGLYRRVGKVTLGSTGMCLCGMAGRITPALDTEMRTSFRAGLG
ncbi:MAG: hypothetical protein IPM48_02690 [Saprospiraceae bacterium]|nr:hypothetical protein [Saprospiraceae bacterium]